MDAILDFLAERFRQVFGRAGGPLNFRLVVMPTVVSILAIRAHLRDVREGKPVFFGAFVTSPTERRRLIRSGLKDFGKVFVVACVLDTIYQFIALKGFYPGEMIFVAVVCAIVPYFLVRGPITRLAYAQQRRWRGAAGPTAATTKPDGEGRQKQESSHE
jgi:hypothetical protein